MSESCLAKQEEIKRSFAHFSAEEKYQKIIELGRSAPLFPKEQMLPQNLVPGCQSIMYLYSFLQDGKMIFMAGSEALISSGLAELLIKVYNNEPPEVVLKCPPKFLDDLGIHSSLTPARSNGLSSLYLRMKQDALKFILKNN